MTQSFAKWAFFAGGFIFLLVALVPLISGGKQNVAFFVIAIAFFVIGAAALLRQKA